ncbi:hypothetical protein B0H11DRAFT_2355679 [Mycena galericulata]|nr:hypothetical protein B0H11DRAFT_2355679 [Mycena galericulata]
MSKSAYDSNVTPGPPLPKSHPSPALISKLHLECSSLYSSARTLAKTPSSAGKGKTKSGSSADGEVSTDLRRFLSEETAFHNGMVRKWLGVDVGENGGTDRRGDAVGFLIWAKKELEDMKGHTAKVEDALRVEHRTERRSRQHLYPPNISSYDTGGRGKLGAIEREVSERAPP